MPLVEIGVSAPLQNGTLDEMLLETAQTVGEATGHSAQTFQVYEKQLGRTLFTGSFDPSAAVTVSLITCDVETKAKIVAAVSALLEKYYNVSPNRIFTRILDFTTQSWGFKGVLLEEVFRQRAEAAAQGTRTE